MMGHLNSFSASGGGNLNKNFSKNTNARGLPGGGMLKLRFDWYITGRKPEILVLGDRQYPLKSPFTSVV